MALVRGDSSLREFLTAMRMEAPTLEQERCFALAPGADGLHWLRLPDTLDLTREDG